MKLIFSEIEDLRKKRKLSIQELSEMIGMTKTGLHNLIKNEDTKLSTLKKISEALGVPMSYWFSEQGGNVNGNSVQVANGHFNRQSITAKEADYLREKIKDLERIIKEKDEIIQLLKERG